MNKKETTYQSPKVDVIDICAESIICASGDPVTVSDPWSDIDEEKW
ncbi:MAG: hypothetical protein MJZ12_08615 [Prevotella sp.]|nr:hypothetical protein [Prevotella sp.]